MSFLLGQVADQRLDNKVDRLAPGACSRLIPYEPVKAFTLFGVTVGEMGVADREMENPFEMHMGNLCFVRAMVLAHRRNDPFARPLRNP